MHVREYIPKHVIYFLYFEHARKDFFSLAFFPLKRTEITEKKIKKRVTRLFNSHLFGNVCLPSGTHKHYSRFWFGQEVLRVDYGRCVNEEENGKKGKFQVGI